MNLGTAIHAGAPSTIWFAVAFTYAVFGPTGCVASPANGDGEEELSEGEETGSGQETPAEDGARRFPWHRDSASEENGDASTESQTHPDDDRKECPGACTARFQCDNAGGTEIAGECERLNLICCDAPAPDIGGNTDTERCTEPREDSEAEDDFDTGGVSDTGGHLDETDTHPDENAVFQINCEISPDISTVGIVSWSVNVPIDSAVIRFGPAGEALTLTAPVNLKEESFRTLLLGMKPDTTYQLVIVAQGNEIYTSEPVEITTGPQRTGLPAFSITDFGGAPYRGFTIGCTREVVYIVDSDGDHVWWMDGLSECSRARMSYDGRAMWAGNSNVIGTSGVLYRISMDGSSMESFNRPDRHHDFAVLDNNHILLIERGVSGSVDGGGGGKGLKDPADILREFDPETGETFDIYNQNEDFEARIESEGSHTNAVNFVPHLDAISFSMLNIDTIAVVRYPDGELLHTYGGPQSDYDAMTWDRQHNHQVTPSGLVLFNNNGSENNGSSTLKFDIEGDTATRVWDYAPGIASNTFGQATELPNGNVLVYFSNNNIIHELSPDGGLVQAIEIGGSKSLGGYIVRRADLYGPPPPWGD